MHDIRRGRRALAGLWLALALLPATSAAAGDGVSAPFKRGAGIPRIVNGLPSQDFPTTGGLLYSGGATIDANNAYLQCSGTLIGCRTFLTAAHCVVDDPIVSHYQVFLQHGGIYAVSSVAYEPAYNGSSGRDVAIVKLGANVEGIAPTTINTSHDLDAIGVGLGGTIAGFGQTAGNGNDYGIKRYGAVTSADCNLLATEGEGNDKLVCWDFDLPVGPAGSDSNTCNGDSGGPLFMDFGAGNEVVGVTSAGIAVSCLAVDHSWDASVYYNAAYLSAQIGADSTATCGSIGAVGDPTVTVVANSGSLSVANLDDSFSVDLAGTPSLVRFTLNGKDDGSFNPNFYVKQGAAGAGPANYDCKADGSSVFGACKFAAPAPGPWSIFVSRAAGSGAYQMTTTVFGVDPPVCGNDVAESGEACDGSDLGACAGPCAGNCTCAPVCSTGDLSGRSIVSSALKFLYRARLDDFVGDYAGIDPRNGIALSVSDQIATVALAIGGADPGWVRADPLRGRFRWQGDGTIDGLRSVKLQRKKSPLGPYWALVVKGREVPGGGAIDVEQVLDFTLTVDGTCHLETW